MTIIDDTDPRFVYKDNLWSTVSSVSDFNGSSHVTSTPSAILFFGPFTGTSISVFGTIGPNQPTVHYVIDGSDSADTRNQSSTNPQPQQLLFLADSLAATEQHNININVLDSGTFNLDFVSITGDSSETQIISSDHSPAATPSTTPVVPPFSTAIISSSQHSSTQLSTSGDMTRNPISTYNTSPSSSTRHQHTHSESAMHISNTSAPQNPQLPTSSDKSLIIGLSTSILIFIGAIVFAIIYCHFRRKSSSRISENMRQYWRHRFWRGSYRVTPFVSPNSGNTSMVVPQDVESVGDNFGDNNQRHVSHLYSSNTDGIHLNGDSNQTPASGALISYAALGFSSALDGDSKTRPVSDTYDRYRSEITSTTSPNYLPLENNSAEVRRASSISSSSSDLPPSYETIQN